MEIPVYSVAGQVIDHVTVDESALGVRPNMALIRQAVLMYEANQRVGMATTKTRAEVSGTGRKPWSQKHTDRARHGSRTSPIWVGGGVAHGPHPRDYRQKMNKAARRRALCSAFLAKALDGQVLVVDALQLPAPKTKEMAAVLRNLGVERSFLLVLHEHDRELWRCTRNIPGSTVMTYKELNAYEMTRPDRVVFTRVAVERFLGDTVGAAVGQDSAREFARGAGVSEDG